MATNPRILIVDDEPLVRDFLSLTFESAGYAVNTAGSGRDAMELCSAEPFDVVLSDVTMPEMNGHQLTQWISTHYPGVRTALMSGYDGTRERRAASDDAGRFIAKPFRPAEVISFVDRVLGN